MSPADQNPGRPGAATPRDAPPRRRVFIRRIRLRRSHRLLLSPLLWRRRLVFWLGGIVIGLLAVAFAEAADAVQALWRQASAVSPLVPLIVTPLGFAALVAVTRRFFPGSQGSGIPQAIAARRFRDPRARTALLSLRMAAGKIGLTLIGLLVGASAGREGPTVQVGASIMHAAGMTAGGRYQGLILAGGAAGIAAAFNTPLAGIVFAIEELSRSFEQRTSGLVLSTVVLAGIASLALLGNYTYFGHTAATLQRPAQWLAVPACGLAGGALGGLFSRLVIGAARGWPGWLGRTAGRYPIRYAGLCGFLVGVIGLLSGNMTYGTGYEAAKTLLEQSAVLPPSFGLFKFAATLLSTISGIPGGIFSPSLAVGAGVGANLAQLLPGVPAGAVILLGMVGYFAGVVQAPITAFVIVMEMTDDHAMVVPLMAASLIGYGTSRLVCRKPIYHALSEQFTARRTADRAARARSDQVEPT